MNEKKLHIIQAAVKLFGERDYHTTSVQDIASLAGISKGAFYQHFQSKEELLLSIYIHYFEKFRLQLAEAQSQRTLSPKELIIKAIELQCKLIWEDQDMLSMMIRCTGFAENPSVTRLFVEESLQNAHWFQQRIIELYGPDIEPHSADCASMLNGAMKEYFFYTIICKCSCDQTELSVYLFERLDDIVQGVLRKRTKPLLPSSLLQEQLAPPPVRQNALLRLEKLRSWVGAHMANPAEAAPIVQSLDAIIAEVGKEQPSEIIIRGMFTFLQTLAKDDKPFLQQLDETIPCVKTL